MLSASIYIIACGARNRLRARLRGARLRVELGTLASLEAGLGHGCRDQDRSDRRSENVIEHGWHLIDQGRNLKLFLHAVEERR